MGPVNMQWFEERGLVENKEITTYYSAGRIDIRDSSKEGYDCWNEYSLPPMHGEDWNDFSEWLEGFQTHELWEFKKLIACYENASNTKIRWAEDTWYKCHECGLITDLQKTTEHIHKMGCSRN
jgi:hypothetical protein